jgi:hypothetical protein
MWLRELVTKVIINPIIRTRTRHFRRACHPTSDSMSKGARVESCRQAGKETRMTVFVFISCTSWGEHKLTRTSNWALSFCHFVSWLQFDFVQERHKVKIRIFISDRVAYIGTGVYIQRISSDKTVTKYSVGFLSLYTGSEAVSYHLFPYFSSLAITAT